MKYELLFQSEYSEWATRRLLSACETLTPVEEVDREPAVWRDLRDYLQAATEDDIAERIAEPDCSIHRWKLVLHLVNHATLHRGQVTSMLRQIGKKPPNTDIFTYSLRQKTV